MARLKVAIVGGGFAGLSAAKILNSRRDLVDITLIDKRENAHFRPLIPDIISNNLKVNNLLYPYNKLSEKYGFSFYCEPVTEINFDKNQLHLSEHTINYDYLIIAAGSQTAFPPGENLKRYALRFESAYDAARIRNFVQSGKYTSFIVCGGGYTGVELASNLQKLIKFTECNTEITLVEMTGSLIGTLPVWMQYYTTNNLREMGINLQLSQKVDQIDEKKVTLSSGQEYKNALCIWTTGLVPSSLTQSLNLDKIAKGRIKVDKTLMFKENCFAAGDISCVSSLKNCPRLSVQAAISQGSICGKNVIQSILGLPLIQYKHIDPGFVVPMANGKSCGEVLGFGIKGKTATLLHYLMSAYRSYGIVNPIAVSKGISIIFQ